MSIKKENIKWISHRGLCQNVDENTLASFQAGVQAGFHYLETDLRATKDGHIVLSHDQILNRTDGIEINVSNSTREELKKIKLRKGSQLLFFDDFFSEFNKIGHVFDIKPETGFEVIKLLSRCKINLEKTIFLLWSSSQQKELLKVFPQANCFASENECKRAGFSILFRMPFLGGIHPSIIYSVPPFFKGRSLFQERIVNCYNQYGAKVLAYLPETKEEAQMAIDAKVGYILSNHDFKLISP
jgi:hypothetical protein